MPFRAIFWGRKLADRSPFPARTPITAADGRASLPFSRWLLNEFAALSEIRARAVTSGAPLSLAVYPQAPTEIVAPSLPISAATYGEIPAAPVFASYEDEPDLPSAPASYPGADAIPLPFGEY